MNAQPVTTLWLVPVHEDEKLKTLMNAFHFKLVSSPVVMQWNNKPCYAIDSSVAKLFPSTHDLIATLEENPLLKKDVLKALCFSFIFQVEFQALKSILSQTLMFFDFKTCQKQRVFDNSTETFSSDTIRACMSEIYENLIECYCQDVLTLDEKAELEIKFKNQLVKDHLYVKTSVIVSPSLYVLEGICCFCQSDCSPNSQACKRCMQTGRYLWNSRDLSSFIIDDVLENN